MKKKLLAIIATAAMVVTMIPAMAFAEVASTDVAKINDNGYATLGEAIVAAGDGDLITLLNDVNESVTVSDKITIDLNGNNIKSSEDFTVFVDGGDLTITDNSNYAKGKIRNTSTNGDAVKVNNSGSFTMEKGNIVSSAYGIYVYSNNSGGTINISGGSIDTAEIAVGVNSGAVNISGGTFDSDDHWVVCHWDTGTINVTGGTFSSDAVRENYITSDYGVRENQDGTFTVYELEKAVKIGDNSYFTLAEAFAAAQPNDVITITAAGEYVWPATEIPAGVTVKGTVEGVVATSAGDTTSINATTLSVENVDFEASFKAAFVGNGKASELTFTDCSFTGVYAFHVDSAAAGAELTFNNCVFNGFTTFATTVEKIKVTGGEINGAFIFRQDTTIEGVEFSEDAQLQLGTNDTVTDINVEIKDCEVVKEDGTASDKSVTDLINKSNNAGDENDNTVVVDEDVVIGDPSEESGEDPSEEQPIEDPSEEPSEEPNEEANDDATQTGDDSNIMLWLALMALAAVGATGTALYRRRA